MAAQDLAGLPRLPCLAPVQQQASGYLPRQQAERGEVSGPRPPAALCLELAMLVLLWRGQAHPGCILQLPGRGLDSGVSFPGDTVSSCQD